MAKKDGRHTPDKDLPKAKLSLQNIKKSFRLFEYLGKNKWKFAMGMFFLVGTAAVGLVFPVVSGKMFSFFGESGKPLVQMELELYDIGKILLLILLIQGVFSFGRVFMFAQVTENILKGLRNNTFKRLLQMPMQFFSQNQVSELSSRMATDINVISEAFTVNIAELIRQSIVGIGGLGLIMYYTSWEIAKWFLMIIPPIIILAILFGKKIRGFSKIFQDKIAESNVIVVESLTGISNVKTFTNENFEITRYEKITESIRQFGLKYGIFRGAFFAFVITFIFGAIFFILWKMLLLKNSGDISPEQFGKFLMLSIFVAASLGALPEQIASIQRALGATERIFELIDGQIESLDIDTPSEDKKKLRGELEFKNIAFSYPSRKDFVVLKDVSFKVKAGETVAIVGKSGSGKSTMAALALRFYEPEQGQYIIDGKPSTDYGLTEFRKQIAIVPQDVLLFSGSIKENIAYGKLNASEEEIIKAAKQANAYDFIMSFPDKFNTLVGERGVQLSGGQRQRVAIARAVLNDPAILILDEATSSLDSESEKLVQEALDKLMEGRTSLVIAHRLSTIRNADKIIVLENGKIKEEGSHEVLMQSKDSAYKYLIEMQSLN
jgi:ABC-type multidrug transport system fused ATPase/permease subunit